MVDKFSSPSVSVNDDRNLVIFTVNDNIYFISEANIGDAVTAPVYEGVVWNMPQDFKVTEKYTEITGEFVTDTRTITWNYDGKTETQTYHIGEMVVPFTFEPVENKIFLGWNNTVPEIMGTENITLEALFENHEHSYSIAAVHGLCTEGLKTVYLCKCGDSYTIEAAPAKHKLEATITNLNELSYATLECENCAYSDEKYITYKAQYDADEIVENKDYGTGTNQVIDLTMYNASDVSVQPDGNISIVLPITSQMNHADDLKIYRVNNDGTWDEIPFTKDSETMSLTMTVDHFSYYMITTGERYKNEMTYDKINCEMNDAHTDNDHDGLCDNCGADVSSNCSHICHSDKWYARIIWVFVKAFCKLFRTKEFCSCGSKHY